MVGLHDGSTQCTDTVGHAIVVCRGANAVSEWRRAHYVGRTVDCKNRRLSGERRNKQRAKNKAKARQPAENFSVTHHESPSFPCYQEAWDRIKKPALWRPAANSDPEKRLADQSLRT